MVWWKIFSETFMLSWEEEHFSTPPVFVLTLLSSLCSSLNPVLYGYLDENFKRCFREFCTPSASTVEMQNSSRTRAASRKLPQREPISADTGERSNQQVERTVCPRTSTSTVSDMVNEVIHFLGAVW